MAARAGKPKTVRAVALLRGVNVGGKNKLPMAALVELFSDAGCDEVRTYIQSGNVIFSAPPARLAALPSTITAAIQARFGHAPPVVLRTAAELAAAADNPFLAEGVEPEALHLAFLADRPEPARAAALDPARSPPDRFRVRDREVYLHLPNGVAKTRITNAWLDAQLRTISTVRNWRTVLQLLELAAG